jgi:hypothetical protein
MGYEDEKNPHLYLKTNWDAGAGAYLVAYVPFFKNNNNGPIKVAPCRKKQNFLVFGILLF